MFDIPSFVVPVILGISSTELTLDEKKLFKERKPLGFILFKRNCTSENQIKNLIHELQDVVGFKCPILIDQEGGRVSRLKKENGFEEFSSPHTFTTEKEAYNNAAHMAHQLKNLGISVNCTPLADLVFKNTHQIIGDRSFGDDPEFVGKMAASVMKAHFDNGITPILKHLPGHGRALSDSHETLPIVTESKDVLMETDFKAFQVALAILKQDNYPSPWGMTAHIVFQDIDPLHCATQSPTIIQNVIRSKIGFDGFLISDCVTMKALTGTFNDRIQKSLQAGCNTTLHCSGIFSEIEEILKK